MALRVCPPASAGRPVKGGFADEGGPAAAGGLTSTRLCCSVNGVWGLPPLDGTGAFCRMCDQGIVWASLPGGVLTVTEGATRRCGSVVRRLRMCPCRRSFFYSHADRLRGPLKRGANESCPLIVASPSTPSID